MIIIKTGETIMCKYIYVVIAILLFANMSFAQSCKNSVWNSKLSQYKNNAEIQSVIFVKCIEGTSKARLEIYKKGKSNEFELKLLCYGYIGKNGLGKDMEGDNKSPIGDFGIINAFGIKPNPGTALNYLKINKNHYCCDENCKYYNKLFDAKQANHVCKGEHIIDYIPQYNYALFLDFNKECVYPKGSAIFMHCFGKKTYTAGCVAVSEKNMIKILRLADKNTRICIFDE